MASSVEEVREAGTDIKPGLNRHAAVRFLVCLIALPLFLYLLPFGTIRTHGFIRWAGSQFSPSLDYSFTTAGQDADVVIYGDSSAFYGVSPVQMSQTLGLKVINLPNTGGSLPVINDLPLRYYLSVNKAPKLIVLYFTPWELDYLHEENSFLFEGEEVLLRHGSVGEIANFARNHPLDLLEYPFMAYSTGPKAALLSAMHHDDRFKTIASNRGHLDSSSVSAGGRKSVSDLQDPCVLPAKFLGKGSDSVERLRAKYASEETRVLVFLAPIPACSNASSILTQDFGKVGATTPNTLAPSSYRDDGSYIHLDPSAVPAATAALTTAVKQAIIPPVR